MKNRYNKYFASILTGIFLFAGCSAFKPPQYPEVIYNDRKPLISVTYEYGEIDIQASLVYPGLRPDGLIVQVFSRGDTIRPLLSLHQEVSDFIQVYLPQGVFDIENETNFIKVIPQHPDFVPVWSPFLGIEFGSIILNPIYILPEPLNVTGVVKNQMTDSILVNVDVAIYELDQLLQLTHSDAQGNYALTILGEYKNNEDLRIIAGTDLIFTPFRKDIFFGERKDQIVNIGIGPSQTLAEMGNIYITNKENVHFRDEPHIGGTTQFLLPKGEPIVVQYVSKGLYFGTIEIPLESGVRSQVSGWVTRDDTDLLFFEDIFKTDDESDQAL
ncbi:uncharacterized protein METZ01_LOCUS179733 [marine metagenome]|uniref:Uncharacterized protein n=1 Tax=marine metagenome TaxID=408172 RepID=A0A382CLX5_9ZZZZ